MFLIRATQLRTFGPSASASRPRDASRASHGSPKGREPVTEHLPTAQSRAKVIGLACNAIRQDRIAKHLAIDPKTLRKHYHDELTFGMEAVGAQAAGHLMRLMRGNGMAA